MPWISGFFLFTSLELVGSGVEALTNFATFLFFEKTNYMMILQESTQPLEAMAMWPLSVDKTKQNTSKHHSQAGSVWTYPWLPEKNPPICHHFPYERCGKPNNKPSPRSRRTNHLQIGRIGRFMIGFPTLDAFADGQFSTPSLTSRIGHRQRLPLREWRITELQ